MERIEQQIRTALDELGYNGFEFVEDSEDSVFIPLSTHVAQQEVEDEIATYSESHCNLIVASAVYSNLEDGNDKQGIYITFEELEGVA